MSEKSIYALLKKDEITLKDLAVVFKAAVVDQIRIVLVVFALFILIGHLDYKMSPVEYESKASVLLEGGGSSTPSATAIANMLTGGASSGSSGSGGAVGPDMYSKIVTSQAFLNALVVTKIPLTPDGKDSTTLEQFFANGAPMTFSQKVSSLPTTVKNLFSKPVPPPVVAVIPPPRTIDTTQVVQNQISADMFFSSKVPPIVQLEGRRAGVIAIVKPRLKVDVVEKNATVSVKMPDSFMAAAVNKLLLEQLINYVTAFNTIKQRSNIAFLEDRFRESKGIYTSKQQRLAGVRDNSLGVIFQSALTRQEIMANELTIAFNIYNQFAVQLEAARIDLKKETPLFTVVEPISLPSPQVEPLLAKTLFKYILYAIVVAILLVGYRIVSPKRN
jgi:hypothetical protein